MSGVHTSHLAWLLTGAMVVAISASARAGEEDDVAQFAECIADSGAVFYGAHWCPVCERQTAAFGSSSYLLPYVECYKRGTREKLSRCKHVDRFPTWRFENGEVQTGRKSFKQLAAQTNCRLP